MSRPIRTIGVDARMLVLGRRTGVEEYTLNLLPRLIASHPEVRWKLFYNAWRRTPLTEPWAHAPNVEVCTSSIPNRALLFPLNAAFAWPKADRLIGGCDAFWSPHIFNIALSPDVRHAITVHDLAFVHYPDHFPRRMRWWHRYLMAPKKQLTRADTVIAVSQATAQDVMRTYRVRPERVVVAHPGVDTALFTPLAPHNPAREAVRTRYNLPDRFILYFGTIEPRKNLAGLIRAFELLAARSETPQNLSLVLAGSPGWLTSDIVRAAQQSPVAARIHFTGFIAETDKPALYALAECLAYPSFFEGFGFPVLEAMACGTPVVTSARASLPEVAGDAALLVDPLRPEDLADALATLHASPSLRTNLAQRGRARAASFSWDASAAQTFAAIIGAAPPPHA